MVMKSMRTNEVHVGELTYFPQSTTNENSQTLNTFHFQKLCKCVLLSLFLLNTYFNHHHL